MYLEQARELAKKNNYRFDRFMPVWSAETDNKCKDVLSEIDSSNIEGSDLEIYIIMNYMFWLALNEDEIHFDDLYYFSIYSNNTNISDKIFKYSNKVPSSYEAHNNNIS